MPTYLKRKRSIESTILPLRAPKQQRTFYQQTVGVIWQGLEFLKSTARMISNPPPSEKPPAPRKARSPKRKSSPEGTQKRRESSQCRPGSMDPKLRYTPPLEETAPPSTPPPQAAPLLAEKSTEIIDLTDPTPEPSPAPAPSIESISKGVSRIDVATAEPPCRPKSFALSTRAWRPIQEVEPAQATGSTSGSSTSDVSFTFSFNTGSTCGTSNTSLPSKPPSPLITDFNTQVPAGVRTAKRNGLTAGSRRPFERQHIHAQQHKARVAKLRQELRDQAFVKQRKRGYAGSKIDFEDIFRYASEVRQVIPETRTVPEFIWEEGYWEEIRKKANDAPLVKPYTPSLDEADKRIRDKNRYLDELRQPKLPESLPAEEDAQVSKLLNTRGLISKCAREQVSDQDISRLRPGQWLNDEIINFYGAMINARSDDKNAKVTRGQVLNVFYLSTFFWEKLYKEGYEKGRLAKWTKKVDIFAKDTVLIPVNHSNRHWTAAAINFKHKRIESYDSMNMAGADVCRRLRQYVEQEHMNKKKKPFDWTGWEDFIDRDHPQQENGFDCGVFTCQTLESLSRGEEARIFTQANMPYIRRKMIWEIGNTRLRDDV